MTSAETGAVVIVAGYSAMLVIAIEFLGDAPGSLVVIVVMLSARAQGSRTRRPFRPLAVARGSAEDRGC